MKNSKYSNGVVSALTAAAMALFVGDSAQATTTSTWTGNSGSTDWNAAADWGGTLPLAGNALVFTSANASSSATLTNTFTAGTSFAGITFNAGALAYTMTGNSIALSAGITNNSSNLETFSETNGITNSASSTFTVNSGGGNISLTTGLTDSSNASQITTVTGAGGTLTLGSFTLNSGAAAITDTFQGTGNINITGAVTNGGAGANALAYNGSGTLTLGGTNTYTGTTTLEGGTVVLNYGSSGNQVSTAALTLGSNLLLSGGSSKAETVASTTVASGYAANISASSGSGDTINLGALTFGSNATINFQPGVATTTTTTGTIAAYNNGATGIFGGQATAGNGIMEDFATVLTATAGTNTIVGVPTYLYQVETASGGQNLLLTPNAAGTSYLAANQGNFGPWKIDTSNGTAAGSYAITRTNAAANFFGSTAILYTGATGANYTISGNPLYENQNSEGSNFDSGVNYLTSYGTGTLTISNQIYGQIYIAGFSGGVFTGVSSTGSYAAGVNGSVVKSGPGTIVLSGINNYVGSTSILQGTLSIGSDNNLGGVSGLLTVVSSSTGSTSVTVSGTGFPDTETLVGASFLGSTITGQTNSGSGNVTLTLAGDAGVTASSGSYAYANDSTQSLNINGGTLQATNSFTLGETATGTAGGTDGGVVTSYRPVNIGANGGTIDVTGSNTLTVAGVVSGAGGTGTLANGPFTKTDSGTLVFAAANTYTGGTTVNGGTLKLDFGATGVSNFTSPTNNILASTGALTLGGGTLSINGAASAIANTQTIASLALQRWKQRHRPDPNSATSVGLTFTNGNFTRTAGSTIDFNPGTGTPPASPSRETTVMRSSATMRSLAAGRLRAMPRPAAAAWSRPPRRRH